VGKIVVTEFVSLDGVMEAPGPGDVEDYEHKAWAFDFNRGKDGDQWKLDETLRSEALLLGRVTYETFAATWPARTGEFADRFNSLPKYVISSTLKDPEWNNTTLLDGDVVEEVANLREKLDGDIVVHGSRQLVQTLFENNLVDELRLMVYPVVLGTGRRVFSEATDRKTLRLIESKTVGDGIVILIHAPARPASSPKAVS
jgi:dihydrofolate reductase